MGAWLAEPDAAKADGADRELPPARALKSTPSVTKFRRASEGVKRRPVSRAKASIFSFSISATGQADCGTGPALHCVGKEKRNSLDRLRRGTVDYGLMTPGMEDE